MVTTNSFQGLIDNLENLSKDVLQKEQDVAIDTYALIWSAITLLKPIANYLQEELRHVDFMGKTFEPRVRGIFLGMVLIPDHCGVLTHCSLVMGSNGVVSIVDCSFSQDEIVSRVNRQSEDYLMAIVETIHSRLLEAERKLSARLEKLTEREQKIKVVRDFLKS